MDGQVLHGQVLHGRRLGLGWPLAEKRGPNLIHSYPTGQAHTAMVLAVRPQRTEARQAALQAAEALLQLPQTPLPPPFPLRPPPWPDDRRGSFSHWQDHSLCLLGRGTGFDLGADVEGWADTDTARDLRDVAMTAAELAHLAGMGAGHAETLIFSAKESFFKAAFPQVGRIFGFEALTLTAPPAAGLLQFALTADLAPALRRGQAVAINYRLESSVVITWAVLAR